MKENKKDARKIYTLLDVTQSLQAVIRKTYTGSYWIKAEIARLNFYPKSGHCYPDLVYKVEGKVKAEMRAIIWRNDFKRLNHAFKEVVKEELKDGMQLLFRANVNFHPKYSLSLNIVDIEPSFTLGEMAREKAATIAQLKKEQVFMRNRQIPFPLLPKRLAVISVSTSKGYHDFLNIIDNNRYGFKISHELFSALLQGDRCAESIAQQLAAIKLQQQQFDAVAIIRGGGGDVGLNAYDDLELARLVATFPLPVISGIGHSTNETVVEMVAHLNKITPTDVAYFFLGKFQDLYHHVISLKEQLIAHAGKRILGQHILLKNLQQLFLMKVKHVTATHINQLLTYGFTIRKEVDRKVEAGRKQLKKYPAVISGTALQRIKENRRRVLLNAGMIKILANNQIKGARNHLEATEDKMHLLNPENILKRGYSLTIKDGKAVSSSKQVSKGDMVTTRLFKGSFESEIKTKNDE
ncbi:MAG: exodeoxyribonuclease VII large subunit [Bacteroidales bacterium]|nr:exodeoxyribonuclease VII large subunit [Bacteroidales bacterium]